MYNFQPLEFTRARNQIHQTIDSLRLATDPIVFIIFLINFFYTIETIGQHCSQ